MAQTLKHGQTAQRSWIQAAGAGEHRADGPETLNALTMEMDQFVGADQGYPDDLFHQTSLAIARMSSTDKHPELFIQ